MEVSAWSINFIYSGITYSLVFPILFIFIFRKRFKAHVFPFFLGLITYLAFAFFLSNIVNSLFFYFVSDDLSSKILVFLLLFASQLLTAIIAQSGKFFSLTYLKKNDNPGKYASKGDALQFGMGFGGMEAFLTTGITMLSYVLYISVITSGSTDVLLSTATPEDAASIQTIIDLLVESPANYYLAMIVRCIGMLVFQIGTTLLVFLSAFTDDQNTNLKLAFIAHGLMILPSCMASVGVIDSYWIEALLVVAIAAVVFLLSYQKINDFDKEQKRHMINEKLRKK